MPYQQQAHRQRILAEHGAVVIDILTEGTGPVVVLIPSLGRDSLDYDSIVTALVGRGYCVVRPRPRGLGRSRGPMDGLTLADLADDTAAALGAVGGGRAVIVGHAFGNWVARMTAVRHPSMVRAVVVAAAAARSYPAHLTDAIRRIVDPLQPRSQRTNDLRATFFAPDNDATVWLDGWHAEVRDSQFAAYQATPRDDWWTAGDVPLLELQAADDPFLPPEHRGDLRNELGSRVDVKLIQNASHALFPEQPEAVVDAISRWINRLPPDRTDGNLR